MHLLLDAKPALQITLLADIDPEHPNSLADGKADHGQDSTGEFNASAASTQRKKDAAAKSIPSPSAASAAANGTARA
eukprot:2708656-Pleurochrysis_carterae.AAC.6